MKEYLSLFQSQTSASYQTLQMWVAGPYRRTPRLGPLISSSENSLHQPERASSSSIRPEGLRTPVSGPIGSSVLRQHHHSSVCPSPAAIHHGLVQGHSGLDPSPGDSRSTSPQMASGDPSFCDLPDREASSVLLPASDSRIAGTDALLQPWDDFQVYAFPPIAVTRKVLVN